MNSIGKVNDRRSERERDNVSLGCEHEGLVVEYIGLDSLEEFVGVCGIRLGLYKS